MENLVILELIVISHRININKHTINDWLIQVMSSKIPIMRARFKKSALKPQVSSKVGS